MLGDLGADVMKVEHPSAATIPATGDHLLRREGRLQSAYFLAVSRNKRSIGVGLKDSEGPERVKELAAEADVVIENWRRGALESSASATKP